jgi:hypothetical protein
MVSTIESGVSNDEFRLFSEAAKKLLPEDDESRLDMVDIRM